MPNQHPVSFGRVKWETNIFANLTMEQHETKEKDRARNTSGYVGMKMGAR